MSDTTAPTRPRCAAASADARATIVGTKGLRAKVAEHTDDAEGAARRGRRPAGRAWPGRTTR